MSYHGLKSMISLIVTANQTLASFLKGFGAKEIVLTSQASYLIRFYLLLDSSSLFNFSFQVGGGRQASFSQGSFLRFTCH